MREELWGEEREGGEKALFYQALAKEGANVDFGPRLPEGTRANRATWLLSDERGWKPVGQPHREEARRKGWVHRQRKVLCGQTFIPRGRSLPSSSTRLSGSSRLLAAFAVAKPKPTVDAEVLELPQVLPAVSELTACCRAARKSTVDCSCGGPRCHNQAVTNPR